MPLKLRDMTADSNETWVAPHSHPHCRVHLIYFGSWCTESIVKTYQLSVSLFHKCKLVEYFRIIKEKISSVSTLYSVFVN